MINADSMKTTEEWVESLRQAMIRGAGHKWRYSTNPSQLYRGVFLPRFRDADFGMPEFVSTDPSSLDSKNPRYFFILSYSLLD